MEDVFIYEFLYRGGVDPDPADDTWHVQLARMTTNIEGRRVPEITDSLTPKRAAELGFPISRIFKELNAAAIAGVKSAVNVRDEARRERDEAIAAKQGMERDMAAVQRAHDQLLERIAAARQAQPDTPAAAKRSLANVLSFGLLK